MLQSAGKEMGPPASPGSSALAFAMATRIQSPSKLSKTFGNNVLTHLPLRAAQESAGL